MLNLFISHAYSVGKLNWLIFKDKYARYVIQEPTVVTNFQQLHYLIGY